MDGNQVVVSIPRNEIASITLCYGNSAERPAVRVIAGIIMCILGIILGVLPSYAIIFNYELIGTTVILEEIASAATLIFLGIVVIIPFFRKSHYLLVETKSSRRKLALKNSSPSEIINLATVAGYQIKTENELGRY